MTMSVLMPAIGPSLKTVSNLKPRRDYDSVAGLYLRGADSSARDSAQTNKITFSVRYAAWLENKGSVSLTQLMGALQARREVKAWG